MVNFNTKSSLNHNKPKEFTWEQIQDMPGLWSAIGHENEYVLLVPHCKKRPIVFYLGGHSQSGEVYITSGTWDNKYVPYQGTLTIGPVTG